MTNANHRRKMEYRVTRCTNCKETFTYRYQTIYTSGENLIIKMSCPYCTTRLKVDLSDTPKKIVSYRSADKNPENNEAFILNLPTELPTTERE